jgi:hypothetical protein
MTKKYTVESFIIVCKMVGRPFSSNSPLLNLRPTQAIAEKIVKSRSELHVKRRIPKGVGERNTEE